MTFFLKKLWGKASGKKKAKSKSKKEKKNKKKYLKKMKKGKHIKKISPYSKEQDRLLKWLSKSVKGKLPKKFDITKQPTYKAGQEYLKKLLKGDSATFDPFEAPMMRQYKEQLIPELAEQYAGADAGRSSAFNLAATHAAGGLAEQLAAQRAQLRQDALGPALEYAKTPIQQRAELATLPIGQQASSLYAPPYVPEYGPQQTHGGGLGAMIGGIGGGMLGGQPGAMIGAGLGQAIGGASSDVGGSEGNYLSGLQGMGKAYTYGLGKNFGDSGGLFDGLFGGGSPVRKNIDPSSATPAFYGTMGTS